MSTEVERYQSVTHTSASVTFGRRVRCGNCVRERESSANRRAKRGRHGKCVGPVMKSLRIGILLSVLVSLAACGNESSGSAESQGQTLNQCSQTRVNLQSAGGFAILAGSTVTNTGLTVVTGDLGVSPGTAVTGFLPGILVGTQHSADPTSANANLDLTVAYNDAAGRVNCPIGIAGNLGGLTLAPGLYKSTSGLEISSGDLTLDAKGDSRAVFVFQMATTFVATTGRHVILAGGALASNVFWQVGSSATLGTYSVMKGTIMADQSITIQTGATLDGRALARIAAVTLDTNAVTLP